MSNTTSPCSARPSGNAVEGVGFARNRRRVNMAHISHSRPDYGLGVQVDFQQKKLLPLRSKAGKKITGHVPTARKAWVTRDHISETGIPNCRAETPNLYPENRDPTPSTQTRNPAPSTQPLHRNLSTISSTPASQNAKPEPRVTAAGYETYHARVLEELARSRFAVQGTCFQNSTPLPRAA